MYDYPFRCALRYRAKSWHGGRGRAHEVCGHIFEATPPGITGHPRVNHIYALKMQYGHQKTPDQSVVHCWGQRLCKGHLGSTRGQIA